MVFSRHSVSSTNKIDRHDNEILLKVVLNTITLTLPPHILAPHGDLRFIRPVVVIYMSLSVTGAHDAELYPPPHPSAIVCTKQEKRLKYIS
jgi:hypothetical protein